MAQQTGQNNPSIEEMLQALSDQEPLPKEFVRPFKYTNDFFIHNTIDLNKTNQHRPCSLNDGTIHTLSGSFKNIDELYQYLRSLSIFKYDGVNEDDEDSQKYSGSFWYWVLSCDALQGQKGVVTYAYIDCKKDGELPIVKYRLRGDTPDAPIREEEVTFTLDRCPSCINEEGVDKSVLIDARPVTFRKGVTPGLPFRRPASTVAALVP